MKRAEKKAIKRKEAEERQRLWSLLDSVGRLNSLDVRLGKGVGAKKQRARIMEKMTLGQLQEYNAIED